MNVASAELCGKLYELSDWEMTGSESWNWWQRKRINADRFRDSPFLGLSIKRPTDSRTGRTVSEVTHYRSYIAPAYDLGYLLRKLPPNLGDGLHLVLENDDGGWAIEYYTRQKSGPSASAAIPEDAACRLAIELFKQGILTPATNSKAGGGE